MKTLSNDLLLTGLTFLYLITLSIPVSFFNPFGVETLIGNLNIIRLIQIAVVVTIWSKPNVNVNEKFGIEFIKFYMLFQMIILTKELFWHDLSIFGWISSSLNRIFVILPLYYILSRYKQEQIFVILKITLLATACIQLGLMVTVEFWDSLLNLRYSVLYTDEGITRYSGVFTFGGSNILAAFQVTIFALFLHLNLRGSATPVYLFISLVCATITVAYTASRAGLLSLLLVLVLGLIDSIRMGKISSKLVRTMFALLLGAVLIVLIFPNVMDNVLYRMTGQQTETDLDLSNPEGRFGRILVFIDFLESHPSSLLFGFDKMMWRDWYGAQVVHLAFLQIIQSGGIFIAFAFIVMFIKLLYQSIKRGFIVVIIPTTMALLFNPGIMIVSWVPMIVYLAAYRTEEKQKLH